MDMGIFSIAALSISITLIVTVFVASYRNANGSRVLKTLEFYQNLEAFKARGNIRR